MQQRKAKSEYKLKQHHHIRLDNKFKSDCRIWIQFLASDEFQVLNRPMVDLLQPEWNMQEVGFTSDASAAATKGFGCTLGTKWLRGDWGSDFILQKKPSIEYLELFALCMGILSWQNQLENIKMIVHCDNESVVHMVNGLTSKCKNCMLLLRVLTLNGLIHNRKVVAKYISMKSNYLSDALSQGQMLQFRNLGSKMNMNPDELHPDLWLVDRVWVD